MPRNKYPEITEARILDTATRLFLEKGWEQTTVQDIVDELGDITRGAFYHHFKSKDEIIDAVTTRVFMGNNPFEAVEKMTGLNGLEKVKYILKFSLKRDDTLELGQIATSVLTSPICIGKQVLDSVNSLAPYFAQYIAEGVADGSIHVEDPQYTAETLLLLLNIWLSPMIFPSSKSEYLRKYEQLKIMFENIGLPLFDDDLHDCFVDLHDKFHTA
ncbi:TetR/AcrR family transcriptional regulator [Anaerovorax odorimutans]|uniref:TetR/AcrR family transcriptional regulator n=1 Tax=Anaerovorax odorimutans TaxID=109327 RepID=A0ABT1RQU7_9FIRM|nr:TetR/AcrR family transcriptional regulator [Anaerovorax odorimutans]